MCVCVYICVYVCQTYLNFRSFWIDYYIHISCCKMLIVERKQNIMEILHPAYSIIVLPVLYSLCCMQCNTCFNITGGI